MSGGGELLRALGVLGEPPQPGHRRVAAAVGIDEALDPEAYTELFVLQCHPYASVHLGPEGMLGGEGADHVAGFFRAVGITPPAQPDHLPVLLGLYAAVADAERAAVESGHDRAAAAWRRTRQALITEHLMSWVPVFLDALVGAADAIGAGAYRQWAILLGAALHAEAARFPPMSSLPRALRVAPELDRHYDTAAALAADLLTPVRSGIVLTRLDLARASRQLEVAARAGERRFALSSMLGQAPAPVLSWLALEAGAWERRHLARSAAWGDDGGTALWWARRCAATSALLFTLADAAQGAVKEVKLDLVADWR
jgi:TorA maturation chaperone TorD